MKDISGKNHTAVPWINSLAALSYFEFKPNNPFIH